MLGLMFLIFDFFSSGDCIWTIHYALEFHVGEALGIAPVALPQENCSADPHWMFAVVVGPHVPILWTIELHDRITLHELLCLHHPLSCLHLHLLDTGCTPGNIF
jgi:hypothetical protein